MKPRPHASSGVEDHSGTGQIPQSLFLSSETRWILTNHSVELAATDESGEQHRGNRSIISQTGLPLHVVDARLVDMDMNMSADLYQSERPDDDEQYDDREISMMEMRDWAVVSLATLYIVITLIGLIANGAVVYIISRSRRSKAVTSIYIFNLAIADLLYVVCLQAAVYPMMNGHWALGHAMCKLYLTCDGVSKFASVMFLVVLSFDRFMAVCHPIAARSVRTAKVAFAAAGVSWLLVIVSMTPVFFYATLVKVSSGGSNASTLQCAIYWPVENMEEGTNYTDGYADDGLRVDDELGGENDTVMLILWNENSTRADLNYDDEFNDTRRFTVFVTSETDWQRRIFTLYLFGLSFAVPLLTVWIFYAMILHRLWAQKRNLFNGQSNGHCSNGVKARGHRRTKSVRAMLPSNKAIQRRRKSTKRVTIMVLSIVVAYTLCWIPYWCVQLTIEFFRENPSLDFEIFTVFSYIAYGAQSINSALNPFLYAFGTNSHRRRLLYWMRRLLYLLSCRRRTPQQLVDATSSSGSTGAKNRSKGKCRREVIGIDEFSSKRKCVTYAPSRCQESNNWNGVNEGLPVYANGANEAGAPNGRHTSARSGKTTVQK